MLLENHAVACLFGKNNRPLLWS